MTWVRFDDQFSIHRKIFGLKDALFRLHVEAIFWCARNTTDGVIRRQELRQIGTRAKPARAAQLVEAGLWHEAGAVCSDCEVALTEAHTKLPDDGWVLHGYLTFQPSRAKVLADREAKAERQARWLASKRNSGRTRDASRGASPDASGDVSTRAGATRDAHPAPPRPEGSGGGVGGRARGLGVENPDWRTLPAAGVARDPLDMERTRRGLALVRENIRKPKEAS